MRGMCGMEVGGTQQTQQDKKTGASRQISRKIQQMKMQQTSVGLSKKTWRC